MRVRTRRIIRIAAILCLGFLLWAGWYIYNKGFTRKWRGYVAAEFRKRGVEVAIRRLTLDPFQGLVAKDVKIIDAKDRDTVLAVVSRIVLDVNYANLLQRRPFLNSVDLRGAQLSLPLRAGGPANAPVHIAELNARVLLPPGEINLTQAEANVHGIRISATGRLINPHAFQTRAPEGEGGMDRLQQTIQRVVHELRSLQFGAQPPRVEITFSGNMAEPKKIFAQATLRGRDIRRSGYRVNSMDAAATYRDGIVELTKLTVFDGSGKANAVGAYEVETGRGYFQLHSTLHLQGLLSAPKLGGLSQDFFFYEPPAVEIRGEINARSEPKLKLLGHIDFERFGYKSVIFDGFETDFSWDGTRWFAHNVRLAHRSGGLTGDALQTRDRFQTHFQSRMNLRKLLPLTSGKVAEFLAQWEFEQPPAIQITGYGQSVSAGLTQAHGTIKLGQTRFRGVPLKSAQTAFTLADRAVTYENFNVERAEGIGSGTFTYDFGKREVRLQNITGTLFPADVVMWIQPKLVNDVAPYKFHDPPSLTANGVVKLRGAMGTDLSVTVNSPGHMDYVFLKKTLPFSNVAAQLHFTEGKLEITDASGTLYDGQMSGIADISLKKEAPAYSAKIFMDNVDFTSLTRLYFNYERSEGKLKGQYEFTGNGKDPRTMAGRGDVAILNGNVFAIPLLGPLSGLLDEMLPGVGYNVARKATCSFDVQDGVITTSDLVVQGRGFSMIGGGKIYFLDDHLDFNIRVNAQGVPGVVLFPVSKLLEYAADGPLSHPVWRPKRLPVF
jgi:AsmA-like C-terminal region